MKRRERKRLKKENQNTRCTKSLSFRFFSFFLLPQQTKQYTHKRMVYINRRFLPTDFHVSDSSKNKSTKCIGRDIFTNAFIMESLVQDKEFFMLNIQRDGLSKDDLKVLEEIAERSNFPIVQEYQKQHLLCCTKPKEFEMLGCVYSSQIGDWLTLYAHKETKLLVPLKIGASTTRTSSSRVMSAETPTETSDAITTEIQTDQGEIITTDTTHRMEECPLRSRLGEPCTTMERRLSSVMKSSSTNKTNLCA